MKRRAIQVIKSRLEDIEVGDIVNREPDAQMGWFEVDTTSILFNGHVQLADVTEQLTVSGNHKDMVGVQLVEEMILDENGQLAPTAAPMMMAAPGVMPVAAPVPSEEELVEAPAAVEPAEAAEVEAPAIPTALAAQPAPEVDLAAEAAAAAAIATEMDAPPAGNGRAVPGVDLALVASLLENLDVGEVAPAISTEISDEPLLAAPEPVIPEGAVAVDGGALPDKPSYKNPVVVPEGTMLPRRSRAASGKK